MERPLPLPQRLVEVGVVEAAQPAAMAQSDQARGVAAAIAGLESKGMG